MQKPITAREEQLRGLTEKHGQAHLFTWWPELDTAQREHLLEQIASIDFPVLDSLINELVIHKGSLKAVNFDPAPIILLPQSDEEKKKALLAREKGEAILNAGQVAALVVAGGQGTRLGFTGPKGAFPIGPISKKPLFAIFAERISAAEKRYGVPIPWYIMTSPANSQATQDFFKQNAFFGRSPDQLFFFVQGTLPAVNQSGKILLSQKHEIAISPDGHGGTFRALEKSGALEDMHRRGIKEISYFQVDNVLVRLLDPTFIGYHALAQAEMSSKVVRKISPEEKVGVIGLRNNKLGVIEYSDLSKVEMYAKDKDANLKYWAGSIAIHMIQLAFIHKLRDRGIRLPFHRADKKVPYINSNGQRMEPTEPNGIKFESFIFDALEFTENAVTMEVKRQEEFSPVKNAEGDNSPQTARNDLMEVFASYLREAGIEVPRDVSGALKHKIEISPGWALDIEEALKKIPPSLSFDKDLLLTE